MIRARDTKGKGVKAKTVALEPVALGSSRETNPRAGSVKARRAASVAKAMLAAGAVVPEKASEPAPPVLKEVPEDVLTVTSAGDPPGTVRLVFPAPASLAGRIDAYWHTEQLGSKSAAIRALLEDALKRWEKGRLE